MAQGSKVRQLAPHGVMLLASVLLYLAAMRIEAYTGGGGGRISPAVWPKAIIVIMGLLCAFELARRVASWRLPRIAVADTAAAEPIAARPGMLAWGVGLVVAYVVAVSWLGFFLTTVLFLAIFPWVGGMRRPVLTSAIAVAGGVALVVVFMRVAYISLPLGEGPFRALSLALMNALGVI